MILAGDVGGTNTRLAVFAMDAMGSQPMAEATVASQSYASLGDIVQPFLSTYGSNVRFACFGVAGPVQQGHSRAVNLPWEVDAQQLARQTGLDRVWLLNDLEATAYGVTELRPQDTVTLNPGAPNAEGNAAIIAAGTGLGEAGLYRHEGQYWPFATEGGHTSFAPGNEVHIALLRHLQQRFSHVSWERVVSGPGLYNIYTFLRDTGRGQELPWVTEEMHQQDPAAVISGAALTGQCALCVHALSIFVELYGAEAGNLALKVMATAGVFIGGGIAPKILAQLREPVFMQAFTAKGRLQSVLEAVPVHVILNDKTALYGAARYAMLHSETRNI